MMGEILNHPGQVCWRNWVVLVDNIRAVATGYSCCRYLFANWEDAIYDVSWQLPSQLLTIPSPQIPGFWRGDRSVQAAGTKSVN